MREEQKKIDPAPKKKKIFLELRRRRLSVARSNFQYLRAHFHTINFPLIIFVQKDFSV